jgi:hypothetical protein
MNVYSYYDRASRSWWAYVTDGNGYQMGDAVARANRLDAIFALGREVGADPEKFSNTTEEGTNE